MIFTMLLNAGEPQQITVQTEEQIDAEVEQNRIEHIIDMPAVYFVQDGRNLILDNLPNTSNRPAITSRIDNFIGKNINTLVFILGTGVGCIFSYTSIQYSSSPYIFFFQGLIISTIFYHINNSLFSGFFTGLFLFNYLMHNREKPNEFSHSHLTTSI